MRVLVTGGAGFIGSAIVDRLVADDHDVIVLDNLDPSAHGSRPDYLRDDVEYRWGDVSDLDQWRGALVGVDLVCHQAAKVGLGVDFGDAPAYVATNDAGTAAGLAALHERSTGSGGPVRAFVQASSMVVYGEGAYECADAGCATRAGVVRPAPRIESDLASGEFEPRCPACGAPVLWRPIDEGAPLDPRNVYAATKVHQEHLGDAYRREHPETEVVHLRYHNVYGPRMPRDTPYAGVASIFRSAVEAGRAPAVFEDGGQTRDFVHVDDVARANLAALFAGRSGAYNVASGEPHTVLDLARALAETGRTGSPAPEVVGGFRLGDVRHVVASPERAAVELGFRAETAFLDGVRAFASAPLREPATRP